MEQGVFVVPVRGTLLDESLHRPILLSGARRLKASRVPQQMIEFAVKKGIPEDVVKRWYS